MKFVGAVFIVASAFFSGAIAVYFEDCGSVRGAFTDLQLSGCNATTMDYCPLKRGKNVTIDLTFVTNELANKVDVKVHGYIAGIPTPFKLPNPNGCIDSGLVCPLEANSTGTYTLTLPIRYLYPKLHVNIKLELLDQEGKDIVCVSIPSVIT